MLNNRIRVPFYEHVARIDPSWDNFNAAIAEVCAYNYYSSFDEAGSAAEPLVFYWFLLPKITIDTCPIFLSGKARTQFPSFGDKLTSPSWFSHVKYESEHSKF